MSHKFVVLFAVLVMVVLAVSACGAAAPAEPVSEKPAETSGPAPAADTEAQETDAQSTLDVVKERGKIVCGMNQAVPGFGFLMTDGSFAGFDVAYCKAVAAAIYGDSEAVEYRPLTASERFTALSAGEIDVLIRNTTWTLTRDTELAGNFAPTTFYDGQGIQVRKDSGIESLEDLEGTAICAQQGTTTELNLADQMAAIGVSYTPVVFETADDTTNAYLAGRCDAWTTDLSGIVARQSIFDVPDDHSTLPTVLSKEPLGPMVRHGDDQWFDREANWTDAAHHLMVATHLFCHLHCWLVFLQSPPDDAVPACLAGKKLCGGESVYAGVHGPAYGSVGVYFSLHRRNRESGHPVGKQRATRSRHSTWS